MLGKPLCIVFFGGGSCSLKFLEESYAYQNQKKPAVVILQMYIVSISKGTVG